MAASKHIDKICLTVTLLTLLLTGLFMNGKALGLTPIPDGDAGDDQFTANDLNAGWDRTGAAHIDLDSGSITGNGAYWYNGDLHIVYAGKYVLSGPLTGGSVIIDANSSDKIWLLLDGVSIHCEDSAALLVEQAKKVFLTLAEGTENVLTSGVSYAADAVSAGIDGTIYARDDLTIQGSGALRITADYQHAIVCNDDLVITGGDITLTAAQDGLHANDSIRLANMSLTITAGDDGMTASNDEGTSYIYIASGNIRIPACYEGVEAVDITIAGGTLALYPTDDGINANGSNSVIRITGGDITIINETGRDADGLDSNGDIHIEGGNLFISVNTSSCALDCGSESGGICDISGGTVIAAGGSNMAEGFSPDSAQCFIMRTTSAQADTAIALRDTEGRTLLSGTIPCAFSSLVLSSPELKLNQTCVLAIGDTEETVTVDNTVPTGGFAGAFGGGMHGRPGMDFSGQDRPQGMPDNIGDSTDRPQGRPDNAGDGTDRPQRIPDDTGDSMDKPQGMPDDMGGTPPSFDRQNDARPAMGGMRDNMNPVPPEESTTLPVGSLPALAASIAVLAAGLAFALLFKRR